MGTRKRDWQNTDYVLNYFGKQKYQAGRQYEEFMAEGLHQGRSEELVGGGLVRSLGGWSAVTANGLKGAFIKSDERILGDSDFVEEIFSEAAETFERRYALKAWRMIWIRLPNERRQYAPCKRTIFFTRTKQPARVKARRLFCYWASSEAQENVYQLLQ